MRHAKLNRILVSAASTLMATFALAILLFIPAYAQDEEGDTNTATIVVQDGGGAVVRAITFTEPITGLAALEATGLNLEIADTQFGPAVCAIESTGCPSDDCFCNSDEFWGYNFSNGESWQSWSEGASTALLSEANAIEGWRWGVFEAPMVTPQVVQVLPALEWLQAQQ
jgi:hypothetical protein